MGTQSRASGALPTWAEADWQSWGRAPPGEPWSTPPTPDGLPPRAAVPGPAAFTCRKDCCNLAFLPKSSSGLRIP